ncbi:hypothetical protein ACHAP8_012172 [Fusarium lateritium]
MSDIQTGFVTQTTTSSLGFPHTQVIDPVVTVPTTTYTVADPDEMDLHNVKAFIYAKPVDVPPPAPKYNDIQPQVQQNPGNQKPKKPELEANTPDDNGSAATMSVSIFGIFFLVFTSMFNIV